MSCQEYRNHKTLIVGEVSSGKTERTLSILRDLLACGEVPLAVMDLAPERIRGVGGKMPLTPLEKERILYWSLAIVPPRLAGKSAEEIQDLAGKNLQLMERAFREVQRREIRTLVINDVSLYFHRGKAEGLLSRVERIPTLVMNGYLGQFFGDSPLSRHEREQMEVLISRCDRVLRFS